MADVFSKAVSANATKNGSVVTTVGVTANYVSDQSRAISGVSENTLENKYDNSFDDPTYYGGGGLSRGLLAYYRFEETSGVRYNRGTIGGGLNLTDNNTVGSTTGAVAIQGNPAVGASFVRGNSEYLSLSDPSEVNVGGADFSISIWFKIDSSLSGLNQNILGVWQTSKFSYRLYYNGSNKKIFWYTSANGTSATSIASSTVSDDTFYNTVLIHDNSSGSEVYLNNSSIGSAGSVVKSQPSVAFVVGGIADGTDYFNGVLDDLAIWNRQITSDEISQVYNSGSGKVLR